MVQELHQVLLERESTCHRTCFSLQLNGVVLDHFAELRNVAGMREGAILKIVEGNSCPRLCMFKSVVSKNSSMLCPWCLLPSCVLATYLNLEVEYSIAHFRVTESF